jgi:hypothetical protein
LVSDIKRDAKTNGVREHVGLFAPKRDEITESWRKLHNEGLHNLYSSPSIIRMIKSRRMIWAWHVAGMGEKRVHTNFWWGIQKERKH